MRRLVDAPLVVQLVVTIGLMFFLMGLAATIWDENSISPLPEFFADKHGIDIGDVVLTWHRFVTIVVAVLIAIFLRILLYRSRTGVAMRAVVDNRELAGLQRRAARPGVGAGVGAGLDDGGDRGDPAGAERRAAGRRAHALHRRRVRGRDHRPAAQPPVDVRGRADHRRRAELRAQLPAVGRSLEHRVDRDPRGDPVRRAPGVARGAARKSGRLVAKHRVPRVPGLGPRRVGVGRSGPRGRAGRRVRRASTPPTCVDSRSR